MTITWMAPNGERQWRTLTAHNFLKVCKSIKPFVDPQNYSRMCADIYNAKQKFMAVIDITSWTRKD